MSTSLSKLHVRFIQTHKTFLLDHKKSNTFSSSTLYIKDSSNFYLINNEINLYGDEQFTLAFTAPTDYLKSLKCQVEATLLEKNTQEFENALLFFNMAPATVKQILLLSITNIATKA